MPDGSVQKVLVIGSGPIIIGQAAEFDYAGTQACKALREEGVTSILVNSNPATIMTDEGIADIVYIEPLTVEAVSRIIERERPDGLLPTLGGQTGLNLAVDLADAGVLDRFNVRLLGTPLETIKKAEDRELFKNMLAEIGEPVPLSRTVITFEDADDFRRNECPLPLVIRPAFTLGGTGGGIAFTEEDFVRIVNSGLQASPIHQILVEQCVIGWKELEWEVMRDSADNCITVCSMENIDPMGVHTGDSIVVAPTQTLTDQEYQMLRSAAIKIIRALGIEGGCNVQFALDPKSLQYFVIEVNPRVSRSSALASKATGYPIARVAARIAVGRTLDEIANAVTKKTTAAFDPTIDYCVVKIPRWPFDKFAQGDRVIGTQMKATGEVMAIDRCFEAALQKAVRSLELGKKSLAWEDAEWKLDGKEEADMGLPRKLWNLIEKPNDQRLWAIFSALRRGVSGEEICRRTKIDHWFMRKFINILEMEKRLLSEKLTYDLLWEAKRMGFSDIQIGTLSDRLPDQVRALRMQWGIKPVFKMVDTCAAEFEAATPYFYSTYEVENEAVPLEGQKAAVISSGPIRIGQGIEFDYCCVHSAWALQEAGAKSIIINSNPETVSTDFDTSNRLYFESLDEESVRAVLENEGLDVTPAIVQFGGQTAINLAEGLDSNGTPIIGSSVEAIDLAEDRKQFEQFLNRLGIPQPPGGTCTDVDGALKIAQLIGYPVLVRPSYVLGGRAMQIVYNPTELIGYIMAATEISDKRPILVDKYLEGKEVEVDAICDGKQVIIPGVMEHIERAGVHSGDSMAVYPGVYLSPEEVQTIVDHTIEIGLGLQVKGLMNVQYVIFEGQVYVLEVNPRASRTVPFLSKVTSIPMVKVATSVMLGKSLEEQGYTTGLCKKQHLIAIKAPVFSMAKLIGVDTYLGPEMKSTGEVMGVDHTFIGALTKALQAAGTMLPPKGAVLISVADRDKAEALPLLRRLNQLDYELYATEGTATMLEAVGIPVKLITKKLGEGHPNVVDVIRDGMVQGVVNTITGDRAPLKDGFQIRRAAAEKGVPCFTSLDTLKAVLDSRGSGEGRYSIMPLPEYLKK
jgi:carbamoyl-phosphate synthase large subunit